MEEVEQLHTYKLTKKINKKNKLRIKLNKLMIKIKIKRELFKN